MQHTYTGAHDMSLAPYMLGVPSGFTAPPAVAALIAAYDVALDQWDAALIAAELARHTLAIAPERDRQALATALEAGRADPGSKQGPLERAAHVADERLRQTAKAVSTAAEAVEVGIRARRADVLTLTIDREKAQIAAVSAAWREVTEQLATVTGQMTATIGEHINFVSHVLGERTRIEPARADLRVPYAGVTGNAQALTELDRLAHADALVE